MKCSWMNETWNERVSSTNDMGTSIKKHSKAIVTCKRSKPIKLEKKW
jgi:hypothetical protein